MCCNFREFLATSTEPFFKYCLLFEDGRLSQKEMITSSDQLLHLSGEW
jgi:hypothetical protein